MFHIGDPPQSFPEEFALSGEEEETEIEYFGRITHVERTPAEMHFMFAGDQDDDDDGDDDDDDVQWMNGELYQWYSESEPEQEDLLEREEEDQEENVQRVRVIAATVSGRKPRRIELILDSGAGVSLAPSWMKSSGRKAPSSAKWTLRDAQGGNISVQDSRTIEVMLEDVLGNQVKIEEVFLIANVINPLLAVGKLFQKGWQLSRNSEGSMLLEDQESHFPVHYKNNSLATTAYVRALQAGPVGQVSISVQLCTCLKELV